MFSLPSTSIVPFQYQCGYHNVTRKTPTVVPPNAIVRTSFLLGSSALLLVVLLLLLFRLASNDLDTLGFGLCGIVHLELHVLKNEGPDFVTEAVGVEVALSSISNYSPKLRAWWLRDAPIIAT